MELEGSGSIPLLRWNLMCIPKTRSLSLLAREQVSLPWMPAPRSSALVFIFQEPSSFLCSKSEIGGELLTFTKSQ